MWFYIRTEFDCNKLILAVSFIIATLIALAVAADGSVDLDAITWIYLNAYVVSLIISAAIFSSEKRERLYTQLPLTRGQIALGDCCVWIVWTLIFYLGACLFSVAVDASLPVSHYSYLLGLFLFVMGVSALIVIAFILANFRNRYWQIAYIIGCVIAFAIFAGTDDLVLSQDDIRPMLVLLGQPIHFLLAAASFALVSGGAMYAIYVRQDYYLR